MDQKGINLSSRASGSAHSLAPQGTGPSALEQQRVLALNQMMEAIGLWKTQRSEMAEDINQVWICLLQHSFMDGRLDLTGLHDNKAMPTMPILVWKSVRELFSSYQEKTPTVSLSASCLTGWPARHTIAAMNVMAPVGTLNIDLPAVTRVDLSRLNEGTEFAPPQTIHVRVSAEHAAGSIRTDLAVPVGSLVLGDNPRESVTVVQSGQRVPLGTGSSSSSTSTSTSSISSSSSS